MHDDLPPTPKHVLQQAAQKRAQTNLKKKATIHDHITKYVHKKTHHNPKLTHLQATALYLAQVSSGDIPVPNNEYRLKVIREFLSLVKEVQGKDGMKPSNVLINLAPGISLPPTQVIDQTPTEHPDASD